MDLLQDEADESKYYFCAALHNLRPAVAHARGLSSPDHAHGLRVTDMAYENKAALDAHRETEHYKVVLSLDHSAPAPWGGGAARCNPLTATAFAAS